jgi:hypothetical protein
LAALVTIVKINDAQEECLVEKLDSIGEVLFENGDDEI